MNNTDFHFKKKQGLTSPPQKKYQRKEGPIIKTKQRHTPKKLTKYRYTNNKTKYRAPKKDLKNKSNLF